ncbi:MAG: 16S rRNA (cytidine(1402)-2'-O)-methyltransferase [Actinomycetota bacterium]
MTGRLFVCATPIGNLEDVTLRLLRVLAEADLVAAEDTRRTRKLLTNHGIRAKLVPYHQANETKQTPYLAGRISAGARIALVSDGGMPGISDPGYLLVRACIEQGLGVEVVPGPSAIPSALVLSGLPTARFGFEGFLPKPAGQKATRLRRVAEDDRTLVFFEAPSRVRATLQAMLESLGNRQVALVREMTKVHEQVFRGSLQQLLDSLEQDPIGEIVLVVQGQTKEPDNLLKAREFARLLVEKGHTKSKAAAGASAAYSVPRRSVYEGLVEGTESS